MKHAFMTGLIVDRGGYVVPLQWCLKCGLAGLGKHILFLGAPVEGEVSVVTRTNLLLTYTEPATESVDMKQT
jgi:hypothetical protein